MEISSESVITRCRHHGYTIFRLNLASTALNRFTIFAVTVVFCKKKSILCSLHEKINVNN